MDGTIKTSARFPLLARIMGWLLLNLLLLGAVLYTLLQVQFHLGLNSLIAGPAGDRILAVSTALTGALRERPQEQWGAVLTNFSSAYKVQLGVFQPDGSPVAGELKSLPSEITAKLMERRGPVGRAGFGMGPPPGKGRRLELAGPPEPQTLFGLKTSDPTRYWVCVRLPIMEPLPALPRTEGPFRPGPLMLILATDSLYSGNLFLDAKLWVLVGLGTLALSVVMWIPPVRGLTRAISQLTRATDAIANGDFSVRVNANRTDEVGMLGHSVNRMADRLDGFVKGQKRFLGDIAHELCSPIARIQVGLGILEQSAAPHQKEALDDVRDEVEEMSGLINELLSFSRASMGRSDAPLEPVCVAKVVRQVIKREGLEEKQVQVQVPDSLTVLGRPDLLRRAVANLVRNAERYAGSAGPISITTQTSTRNVELAITDQGTGVADEELQKIFDPFYRAEASRSRDTGGAGLGLAIVKSCVEACGGTVHAENVRPKGFQVVITLRTPPT